MKIRKKMEKAVLNSTKIQISVDKNVMKNK